MTNKEIKNILNEIITPEIRAKADEIELAIINNRGEKLYDKYGPRKVGDFIRATAINKAKKTIEKTQPTPEQTPETMDENKMRQMIRDVLSKPLDEKKKSPSFTSQYDDKFNDKRKNLPDGLQKSILKKQGGLEEDLDLGHQDNEPHMIKAELAQIGKYAMELYKMVDNFEGPQEVDFPAWWQSKITTAKNMISSAKHYLEFELNEPKIDAMVGIASEEDIINEYEDKTPKHKIVRQWVGPNSTFILATKPESEWDKKDHDLYNRILKMVQTTGKIPANLEEEMTPQKSKEIGMPFKDKIKEAILAKLQESKK